MTQQIKKILVPLDGSENSNRGLDAAIYQAQQSEAEIVGITATPPGATAYSYAPTYTKQDVVNAKKILNDAEKVAVKHNISFNSEILHGNASKEIVKFAEDNNFDLIAIGARGLGSVKEVFLGSVSHYITHRSKVPVLLVK